MFVAHTPLNTSIFKKKTINKNKNYCVQLCAWRRHAAPSPLASLGAGWRSGGSRTRTGRQAEEEAQEEA
jgi:hypothetical protein